MHDADDIAGLASQPQHGVVAHLARRFGGLVRGRMSGIVRLRRHDTHATESPAPPRRARTAPVAASPRSDRLTRWLHRRRAAVRPQADLAENEDIVFTPQNCPGLSQEACDLFNTPAADLHPDVLRMLLMAVAEFIATEKGLTQAGAEALFGTLWQSLRGPVDPPASDEAAPAPQDGPTPDEPTPDGPAQDGPAQDGPAPDEPAQDEPTPDESTPDEPPADETAPDEPQPDAPTPNAPEPDETPAPAAETQPKAPPPQPHPPAKAHSAANPGNATIPGTVAPTPQAPPPPGNRRSRLHDSHRLRHRRHLRRAPLRRSTQPGPRRLRYTATTGPP